MSFQKKETTMEQIKPVLKVSLTLLVDIEQWESMGFEVKEDEYIDFAKEEFMDWIRSMRDSEILECLSVEDDNACDHVYESYCPKCGIDSDDIKP